jgi:hypothetical protein
MLLSCDFSHASKWFLLHSGVIPTSLTANNNLLFAIAVYLSTPCSRYDIGGAGERSH